MREFKKIVREVYLDTTKTGEPTNDNYSLFVRMSIIHNPSTTEIEHFLRLLGKVDDGYHVLFISEGEHNWDDIDEKDIIDYNENIFLKLLKNNRSENLLLTNLNPFTSEELNKFFEDSVICPSDDIEGIYEFSEGRYIFSINSDTAFFPEDFDNDLTNERNVELWFANGTDEIPCEFFDEPKIYTDEGESKGSEYCRAKKLILANITCDLIVAKSDIKED